MNRKVRLIKRQQDIDENDTETWIMNICQECGGYFKPNPKHTDLLLCGQCSQNLVARTRNALYVLKDLSKRVREIEQTLDGAVRNSRRKRSKRH